LIGHFEALCIVFFGPGSHTRTLTATQACTRAHSPPSRSLSHPTRTHTRTHARTPHTHAHTHIHAHTHAHAHARARARAHARTRTRTRTHARTRTRTRARQAAVQAKAEHAKASAALGLKVLNFEGFGKSSFKRWQLSPDAGVQMALQTAFYELHGKLPAVRNDPTLNFCVRIYLYVYLLGSFTVHQSRNYPSLRHLGSWCDASSPSLQYIQLHAVASSSVEESPDSVSQPLRSGAEAVLIQLVPPPPLPTQSRGSLEHLRPRPAQSPASQSRLLPSFAAA
jgi:Choline/Carnitine o-acyltransferase